MADIVLKNQDGSDAVFEGVDAVSFRSVGGGKATFTSGGGGVTSWNDLTDKPFEEKVEYTDTLTWDGDLVNFNGYKIFDSSENMVMVHMSDSVPLLTDLQGNFTTELTVAETGEIQTGDPSTVEFIEEPNGILAAMGYGAFIMIIPANNFDYNGLLFEKKGVYFVGASENGVDVLGYNSKFSIPGYSFKVTTIKQIDEKFIPKREQEQKPVKELIMYSSDAGSNKKFRITVNDNGELITRLVRDEGEGQEYYVQSVFDNDADGVNDSYTFTRELPEEFTGNSVYHINAVSDVRNDYSEGFSEPYVHYMLYDEVATGTGTLPPHVYCYDGKADNYLRYDITVQEYGIYELCAYLRIKDQKLRGATYTINKGTEYEHSFATSHSWNTSADALEVVNSEELQGSYMRGMRVYLNAGVNTIHITVAEGVEKSQHFRELFLVKVDDLPTAPPKVTMHEAEEMGIKLAEGIKLPGYYDIEVTFNDGAPRSTDGFCRVVTDSGRKMSIQKITLADGQYMPEAYDTVTLRGKIGCIDSAVNAIGRETRIFSATIV